MFYFLYCPELKSIVNFPNNTVFTPSSSILEAHAALSIYAKRQKDGIAL